MNEKTIKHTGNLPENFTGVIYNDTGKNNYAAMVNGQWLKRKDGKTRWFKYESEAAKAAERACLLTMARA